MDNLHKENNSVRRIENSSCCYRAIKGGAIRLIWELTGRCNLNCHHCFANVNGVNSENNELTTKEALSIVSQLYNVGIRKVMLTGGEPFLRRDLLQIISAIRNQSRDIIIDITTNALLLNHEMIAALKENMIDELSISFDGTEPTYKTVRGAHADYKQLVNNIELLLSIGIKVDGILVLTKETLPTLFDTLSLAADIGFSSFSISKLMQLPHSNFDFSGLSLPTKQLQDTLEKIYQYQELFENKMIIRTVGFTSCAGYNCANTDIIAINRDGIYMRCLNHCNKEYPLLDSRKVSLKYALKKLNSFTKAQEV